VAIGGQVKTPRLLADFRQAAALLRDKNLVWSADLDTIREDLALYLESAVISGEYQNTALQRVVQALIADENDLSI
jgi:hypothetical protein